MIRSLKVVWLSIGLWGITTCLYAQNQADTAQRTIDTATAISGNTDTLQPEGKHSPVKASLFSMVLPGLGQAYNRKFWKIPLVYAGIGIPLYYAIEEHKAYKNYYDEYRYRRANDTLLNYPELTSENLLEFIDTRRRNRDLLVIVSSVVYILNIVDASVDAHFFYFEVNDDLSLHIQPTFTPMAFYERRPEYMKGIRLTLNFN